MSRNSYPSKRVVTKLILIFAGVCFGIAIAEIALRIAGYSFPLFYEPDASRGYALLPGAEGPFSMEGSSTYIRINSDGLCDVEHNIAKPENTVRIAIIGDSYAEAMHVGIDKAFWAVLQPKLRECNAFGGRNIEVINFGVSGYGTAQELITLRERVWKYSPDIVMLAVTTANDVTDNSRMLKRTDDIPYFVFQNNRLTLDDSFRHRRSILGNQSPVHRFGRWLRVHSRIVQAVIEGHRGFKATIASWRSRRNRPQPVADNNKSQNSQSDLSQSQELGLDNFIYVEPPDPVRKEAWQITEQLIVTMRDEVQGRAAKFLVVTLSNGPQVLPSREARENFMHRFGVSDLFYPDNRIKAVGIRENFPVIMLGPQLQSFAEQTNTFLHGFGTNIGNGHWNQAGHRAAGEILAKKMCEGGLFK